MTAILKNESTAIILHVPFIHLGQNGEVAQQHVVRESENVTDNVPPKEHAMELIEKKKCASKERVLISHHGQHGLSVLLHAEEVHKHEQGDV